MDREVGRVVDWLSLASGVLSIVLLVSQAFQLGFSAPLEALLGVYRAWVHFLLGWTEPYWESLLTYVSSLVSIDLQLHPHWRDVFVLMALYFGAEIRTDIRRRRFKNVIVGVLAGSSIVLIGSIGAGVAPLNARTLSDVAVGLPIGGFVVYALLACVMTSTFYPPAGQTWWRTFRYYLLTTALPYVVAGVIAFWVGALASSRLPSPSFVALGSFLVAITLYLLCRGVWLGLIDRAENQSLSERFLKSGSGRFAWTMIKWITGVIVFFALNAGLKFVEL